MLKNVRKTIDGNANHCNKELSTIKRSQSKLDNSIAKMRRQRNMQQMKEQSKNPTDKTKRK